MRTCESNSERLSALADGELGGIAAWRLRRHVAACAGCAAELADWKRMAEALREADFVSRESVHPLLLHQPVARRSAIVSGLLGAVAATALVAGMFFTTTPHEGSRISSTAVQAAVDEAMSRVRNAQWHETQYCYYDNGKMSIFRESDCIARLDPATLFRVDRRFWPGKPVYVSFSRADAAEIKNYNASPRRPRVTIGRKFRIDQGPGLRDLSPEVRMRRRVMDSMYASLDTERSLISRATKHQKGASDLEPISPTIRVLNTNGHILIEIRDGTIRRGSMYPGMPDTQYSRTIVADEYTHRIVSTEFDEIVIRGRHLVSRTVCGNYRYNQPLPASAFDLTVPPGTDVAIDGTWRNKARN